MYLPTVLTVSISMLTCNNHIFYCQTILSSSMTRQPTRRLGNGAPRRAAKRQRNKNSRWMHLSASVIGTRQLVQRCWARHTVAATTSIFLAAYCRTTSSPESRTPQSTTIYSPLRIHITWPLHHQNPTELGLIVRDLEVCFCRRRLGNGML